jgi:hypothetical protein
MTHVFGSNKETKIVLTGPVTYRIVIRDREPDGGPSTASLRFVDEAGHPIPVPDDIIMIDMAHGDPKGATDEFVIEAGCPYMLMRGRDLLVSFEQESRAVARAGAGWTVW